MGLKRPTATKCGNPFRIMNNFPETVHLVQGGGKFLRNRQIEKFIC